MSETSANCVVLYFGSVYCKGIIATFLNDCAQYALFDSGAYVYLMEIIQTFRICTHTPESS